MAAFDLVIFDCDGVLIDSEMLAIQADAAVYAEHGLPVSADHIRTHYVGLSKRAMFADIEARIGRPLPPGLHEATQARILSVFESDLLAMAGITTLLDRLTIPACVASSSTHPRLKHSLSLVGLYSRFAPNIFSATDVARGKPAPDLFLFAAEKMSADPQRCLVIEDSVHGIKGAKAAGMTAYGFCGGSHCGPAHDQTLRAAGADAVFLRMDDLASALCAR
jgi:HAD superfamily hydrolase (TIGR01509 family)